MNPNNEFTPLRRFYAIVGFIFLNLLLVRVFWFIATADFCPLFYHTTCVL